MILHLAAALALQAAAVEPPKLTFGGQIRTRAETTSIKSYATAADRRAEDVFSLRSRLNLGIDASEQKLKGFLQLQDSRTWGEEATVATNQKNVDLHQGYLDILDFFGQPLDLRAGRMELSYGDQRLVSPLDWSNVGRAWDGARLKWRGGPYWVDLFVTKVSSGSHIKRDSHFWGAYGSFTGVEKHEFDVYLLGRDRGEENYTNEQGTRGNLSDRTVGVRFKGTPGAWDYTGEVAKQFGRKAGQHVRAWAAAATGGYTFEHSLKPRLGAEYDFASGDSDPNDNRVQTFDPLYPFGHALQGYQDVFSWKNGHALKGSVSVDPKPGWKVQADYHHFRLHRSFDGWYDAATNVITRDTAGRAGKHVGDELDLHVRGKFRDLITLWFGYSRFFAGSYVKSTTGRGGRDWAFFQAALSF